MGSETQSIEVRGSIYMGVEVGGFYGSTLGTVTGDSRAMVYFHWPNISWRSLIESSWLLQVTSGASVISQVSMDMEWMMIYSGVIEGCTG